MELICLLLFTLPYCNYVVFVWRGFLFLWVLGICNLILLWHSLSLPYNYFAWLSSVLLSCDSVYPSIIIIDAQCVKHVVLQVTRYNVVKPKTVFLLSVWNMKGISAFSLKYRKG